MTQTHPAADLHLAAAQRRTVRVLVLTQAVGATGITIGIATASLLARDLSGSEALSGLAQTAQVLGAAVISFLMAGLMARRGRRIGLAGGYFVGAVGAALAVLSGVVESMAILLVGAVLLGAASSANSAARYAATDLASDTTRARSLSIVVWASTIGAVAGPNLTGPAGDFADVLGIPELVGPFAIATVGMLLATIVVATLLRPDPLLLARTAAGATPSADSDRSDTSDASGEPAERASSWRLARTAIKDRPVLGAAILGMSCAHAAMVGVMVMTPLHMEHGDAGLELIGVVISVHVLGMYAFSPVVGILADRMGRAAVLVAGGVVLIVALLLSASAPAGMSWQITAGLLLLGLGWSLAMVASSTLVAEHTPLASRTAVQGTSDLIMGVAAAGAGALAGLIVDRGSYPILALVTLALALGVTTAGVRAHLTTRRAD